MRRLCTICARGGSKGVVNKNIRELFGKPLIAYSILQAKCTTLFDSIAVSSDSEAILDISNEWGADYLIKRPPNLASDEAAKLPAIQHCVEEVECLSQKTFNVIVDLDATAPLRDSEDIIEAVNLLDKNNVSNVITGAPARRSPYFNLVELNDRGQVRLSKILEAPIVRRQDSPKCYDMNASIYVWQRNALITGTVLNEDTLLYVMPEIRSIDIDSELDFELVTFLMQRHEENL
jgi:CMP-N,N'-diacetyllegionaminic acid synthase